MIGILQNTGPEHLALCSHMEDWEYSLARRSGCILKDTPT